MDPLNPIGSIPTFSDPSFAAPANPGQFPVDGRFRFDDPVDTLHPVRLPVNDFPSSGSFTDAPVTMQSDDLGLPFMVDEIPGAIDSSEVAFNCARSLLSDVGFFASRNKVVVGESLPVAILNGHFKQGLARVIHHAVNNPVGEKLIRSLISESAVAGALAMLAASNEIKLSPELARLCSEIYWNTADEIDQTTQLPSVSSTSRRRLNRLRESLTRSALRSREALRQDFDLVGGFPPDVGVPVNSNTLYSEYKRARTGNPYSDGLVGIEPNPGPPKKSGKKQKKSGGKTKRTNRMNRRSIGQSSGSYTAPVARSVASKHWIDNGRSGTFLGSPCQVFSGAHMMYSIQIDATGNFLFEDGTNTATIGFLNPRVCCQLASFSTPGTNCPLNLISSAYRKFCFTKLRFQWQPVAASTADKASFVMAFLPEAASAVSNSFLKLTAVESSIYGPLWRPQTLDVTPYLDKSKWYESETSNWGGGLTPSAIAQIQGLLTIKGSGNGVISVTQAAILTMEFEIALFDMAPAELINTPTFYTDVDAHLRTVCDDGKAEVPAPGDAHSAATSVNRTASYGVVNRK